MEDQCVGNIPSRMSNAVRETKSFVSSCLGVRRYERSREATKCPFDSIGDGVFHRVHFVYASISNPFRGSRGSSRLPLSVLNR